MSILDRPIGAFVRPGADTQPETLEQVAQKFVAMIIADRQISEQEKQVVSWVLASIQSAAQAKVEAGQQAMPEDEGQGQDQPDESPDDGGQSPYPSQQLY